MADAVELEEDRAVGGGAGRPGTAAAVGEAVEPAAVRVVVPYGQGGARGGGEGGHHGRHDDGGLRGHLAASGGVDAQRDQQQRPVEHEDEEPEHERGHQQQEPYEHRPDEGRQEAEGAGAERGGDGDPGGAVAVGRLDLEVRQQAGEHEHGDRGHGPHRDAPPDLTDDPPPTHAPHAQPTSPRPSSVRAPALTLSQRAAGPPGARGGGTAAERARATARARPNGRRTPPSASTVCGAPGPSSGRRTTARRDPPSRRPLPGGRTPR